MTLNIYKEIHPHQLTVISDRESERACHSCQEQLKKSRFWRCSTCEFAVCHVCWPFLFQVASAPPSQVHKHPLQNENPTYTSGVWVCDQCGLNFNTKVKSWRCSTCEFDLCDACYRLPPLQTFKSWMALKEAYKKEFALPELTTIADIVLNYLNPGIPRAQLSELGLGNLVDVKMPKGSDWKSGRITSVFLTAENGWMANVKAETQVRSGFMATTSLIITFPVDSNHLAPYGTKTTTIPWRRTRIPGALMLHAVSGRLGFQPFVLSPVVDGPVYELWLQLAQKMVLQDEDEKEKLDDEIICRNFLMALVKRASALRLSEEFQLELDQYRDDGAKVFQTTENAQLKALREFGFYGDKNEALGLRLLRSAATLYPNEPQIKDTFYVKYNRSEEGSLQAGDICPDVPMINEKGEKTTLFATYRELAQSCTTENKEGGYEPPLVVIAGSGS